MAPPRAGAVAGADRPLEQVPEVVEASVGMLGVDLRQIRQSEATFVDKEEGIDPLVGCLAGGQGLQDRRAHDPDPGCVLNQHGVASRGLNLGGHAFLPSCPLNRRCPFGLSSSTMRRLAFVFPAILPL
jgi:hypothetical protein